MRIVAVCDRGFSVHSCETLEQTYHTVTGDCNAEISNPRISGLYFKIPIFTMTSYSDFEIVIFAENYDHLIPFALPVI